MIPVPAGLSYLPFQEDGIRFAAARPACLIGDEMGLGKTVQAIGVMNCHPEWARALVVCPASLKINWRREIDKWLISPVLDVDIVNYDILDRFDLSPLYDVAVLDEGHYIKELTAQRSGYCRRVKARRKLLLSGVPILSRPIDIWHPLHWLRPDLWPKSSYDVFGRRFCGGQRKAINRKGDTRPDYLGASNLDELSRILKPIMIRRYKRDVLKGYKGKRPPQVIELPADGLDSALLAKLVSAGAQMERTIESFHGDVHALEDTIAAEWKRFTVLRHAAGKATVPMALPIVRDAVYSMGKVVVFAFHRDVIASLAEGLAKFHPVIVQGRMSEDEKQKSVDLFQDKTSPNRVFIGQITAAGAGLTLTAASHVIFTEFDWTPGNMDNATDRVDRIGQTEPVTVQYLVLENSLDIRMLKGIVRKQKIIDKALGAEKKQEEPEWWT